MRTRISIFALASACAFACSSKTSPAEGEPAADQASPKTSAGAPEGAAPTLPDAEALLARAVEASGGAATVQKVHSFHSEGEISIVGQAIRGKMSLWWKDGDFYTVQEIPGIGVLQAGKRGDTLWSQDPITGLRQLEGVEAEQHRWASSFLLPADWKTFFKTAETLGERTLAEGPTVYDVKLTSESGAEMQLSFDKTSGLPIEQKFEQVSVLGNAPLVTLLEDYREVDGLKLPFKQVTKTSVAQAIQQTHTLELDVEVDTSKFAIPSRGEEVVDAETLEKPPMPRDADGKPGRPVPAKR